MYSIDVSSVVRNSRPEPLKYPITSFGQCEHVVDTALTGQTQLSADYLLVALAGGKLVEAVGNVLRRLNLEFIRNGPQSDEEAG